MAAGTNTHLGRKGIWRDRVAFGVARFIKSIYTPQYTTATLPSNTTGRFMGALVYDTTVNKLKVGTATAWETVTSS
jgi:hypothetical protein